MSPAPETQARPLSHLRTTERWASTNALDSLAERFWTAEHDQSMSRASTTEGLVDRTRQLSVGSPDVVLRPVLLHKVFVIRCAHCKTFFTDRGMRAILLLRPSIVLYSTDASPVNSGPLYGEGYLPSPQEMSERTCTCLSQSLGCLHCGASVGYHIITPCERCTGTSAASQRTANGHRYVFHFGQVEADERRFTVDEAEASPSQITLHSRGRSRDRAPSLGKNSTPAVRPESPAFSPYTLPAPRTGEQVFWAHIQKGGEAPLPVDPAIRASSLPIAGR